MAKVPSVPVGDLWIPWYVYRDNPAEPIKHGLPDEIDVARQLRVRDIDDPAIWEALGKPSGDVIHAAKIESLREVFAEKDVVAIFAGVPLENDSWLLLDGCHRACALYLLDRSRQVDIVPPGWLGTVDEDPRLRWGLGLG